MILAPEHELENAITTGKQRSAIYEYLTYVKSRGDRERMAEVKLVTGCFTGAYSLNPFDGRKIPIWIAEYVLAGYGTGAIMAVPCGDQRDFDFATHFNIPITNIIGDYFNGKEANPTKEATLTNSSFLDGIKMKDAIDIVLKKIEEEGIGQGKINYKKHDAGFSRQRYWGEPFPIVYRNGVAYPLGEKDLPVELPHVENYKPGPEGEGPLANIPDWVNLDNGDKRETNTMPGYAGSSWYFFRYMDPHNEKEFADRKAVDYWNQVDVYVGGTEHAVGHLLYSRMWKKVLYDLGLIGFDEPYKKLVNQGMIQGVSELIYRYKRHEAEESKFFGDTIPYSDIKLRDPSSPKAKDLFVYTGKHEKGEISEFFFSADAIPKGEERYFIPMHINIGYVNNSIVNISDLLLHDKRFYAPIFRTSKGYFKNGDWYDNKSNKIESLEFMAFSQVDKMSKSKLNVINPNDIINKYGADTFRMYEMFLGPVEASKPWDTKGIEGVHRFLKKLWRLFYDEIKGRVWNEERATDAELKVLHKTIKKIEGDTEHFSYNTAVSAFMVCVNEFTDLKCHQKEILEPQLLLLTPYAPHIAEELYHALNNETTILDAAYPKLETKYLIESEKEYPVSINGKMRTTITISLDASQEEVEKIALNNYVVQKWIEGKQPKKIIYVRNKMVNVVI
jgi:leucyl-tRNA synthetase